MIAPRLRSCLCDSFAGVLVCGTDVDMGCTSSIVKEAVVPPTSTAYFPGALFVTVKVTAALLPALTVTFFVASTLPLIFKVTS